MEDMSSYMYDEVEDREPARQMRQLAITQPQFKPPMPTIPPRDRYRAARRHDNVLDVLDEESYGQGLRLDSFDKELLQQPYNDRQEKASRGQARLSFPPNPSKYFSTGRSLQPQPVFHTQERRPHIIEGQREFKLQPPEFSSDPQPGTSSPAFKAGQRRAETYRPTISYPTLRESLQEVEYGVLETPQRQIVAHDHTEIAERPRPNRSGLSHAPPIIQGIPLVCKTELPDRLRPVFPYGTFNAVQSKCFHRIYKSDDNFVLASPTGSGKTVILELAICRAFVSNKAGQYKVVYQAPIKALCAERQRDWQRKFSFLGIKCVELTGDSDSADLRNVQTADIIITTPEKWDSITRKWKDHEKLMRLIKLFLIDEVHILKETRGATLEAVVSRMKAIGTDVRFVALSATIPNSADVAAWLGKSPTEPDKTAHNERFGEEFRPVKLTKHVCGYSSNANNEFGFEKFLDSKLPAVITRYSEGKPIMIFCFTRASCVSTAKMLAHWWSANSDAHQYWKQPSKLMEFRDQDLRGCTKCGVSFHHAGLDTQDRNSIEKGFLEGDISVICCTSTLAIGVNLPCQFVIIKNTVAFSSIGVQEYSDLEIMQMIGRAGRPQYDTNAVAVIMTRQNKAPQYETMVSGEDLLESKLHLGLIEHLNAETVLGTIRDLSSAKKWLYGTFLYVRLKQNPTIYNLGGTTNGQSIDQRLDEICMRDIGLLQGSQLISGDEYFRCTALGEAMARYYVKFETMQIFMGLRSKAQISEILSALSQAAEFKDFRFRAGENSFYKSLNQSPSIRFPIPVPLKTSAHKISIIIQSILGSADILWDGPMIKHKTQYQIECGAIFKHSNRLIRCIVDCQISLGDSAAIANALLVQRSVSAQAWDDSPIQMKQIPEVGVVSVRKLVNAGIRTIEELEFAEPHRIEMILGRNPPFGFKLLKRMKTFPKLRISMQIAPGPVKRTLGGVKVQVKVELGFLNEKTPISWKGHTIYVCLLVETSDSRMAHFARISGEKLGEGAELSISALITSPDQSINGYVMCDDIAGTMRGATAKPKIAPSMFPAQGLAEPASALTQSKRPMSNMSIRRSEGAAPSRMDRAMSAEFDDGINDDDLVQASVGDLDFVHIENFTNPIDTATRKNTAKNKWNARSEKIVARNESDGEEEHEQEPTRLENGRWACHHRCKDKTGCKHFCCREGLAQRPKPKRPKKNSGPSEVVSQRGPEKRSKKENMTQTKLQLSVSKRRSSHPIEELDLTQQEKRRKTGRAVDEPQEFRTLHQLHKNTQGKHTPPSTLSAGHKKPEYCYTLGGEHNLSFLDRYSASRQHTAKSSDYGELQIDDVTTQLDDPEKSRIRRINQSEVTDGDIDHPDQANKAFTDRDSDIFGDDDSLLGEAMVRLADSRDIQATKKSTDGALHFTEEPWDWEDIRMEDDVNAGVDAEARVPFADDYGHILDKEDSSPSTVNMPSSLTGQTLSNSFNNACNRMNLDGTKPGKSMLEGVVSEKRTEKRNQGRLSGCNKEDWPKNSNLPEPPRMPQRASLPEQPATAKKLNFEEISSAPLPKLYGKQDVEKTEVLVSDTYKDLEPWLFAEFGDIVELVED